MESIDTSVKPCDNFYKFACGNYRKNDIIPETTSAVSQFSLLKNKIEEQLHEALEEKIQETEPRYSKLAKSAYKSCMDEDEIENDNLTSFRALLDSFGGWPVLETSWNESDFVWINTTYKLRNAGFSFEYIFDISIAPHYLNSSRRILVLDHPGFGLPKKYLKNGLDDKITKAYYNLMIDVAKAFGADEAQAKSDFLDVLDFEMLLSNVICLNFISFSPRVM